MTLDGVSVDDSDLDDEARALVAADLESLLEVCPEEEEENE
jgi:hypothetical protein